MLRHKQHSIIYGHRLAKLSTIWSSVLNVLSYRLTLSILLLFFFKISTAIYKIKISYDKNISKLLFIVKFSFNKLLTDEKTEIFVQYSNLLAHSTVGKNTGLIQAQRINQQLYTFEKSINYIDVIYILNIFYFYRTFGFLLSIDNR